MAALVCITDFIDQNCIRPSFLLGCRASIVSGYGHAVPISVKTHPKCIYFDKVHIAIIHSRILAAKNMGIDANECTFVMLKASILIGRTHTHKTGNHSISIRLEREAPRFALHKITIFSICMFRRLKSYASNAPFIVNWYQFDKEMFSGDGQKRRAHILNRAHSVYESVMADVRIGCQLKWNECDKRRCFGCWVYIVTEMISCDFFLQQNWLIYRYWNYASQKPPTAHRRTWVYLRL